MNILQKLALSVLRGYKWAISPLFLPCCRYVPTCSEYAMDAIAYHGVALGSAMAIWRLLRCHPFAKGGMDPVRLKQDYRFPADHRAGRACSH